MIAGMAAKATFDHLTEGAPLSWRNFLIPLLISPMMYGGVFQVVRSSDEQVLMLILGFQNGFFWQDIFGGYDTSGTPTIGVP